MTALERSSWACVLLLLSACAAAEDLRYTFVTGGRVEGGMTIERPSADTRRIDYQFNDRGRGPKIQETVRLDAQGRLQSYRATGRAYMGSAIDERFELARGQARWSAAGEKGERRLTEPHLYVPVNGSPALSALTARALLADSDHSLPALPGGQLSLRKLETLPLEHEGRQAEATLYALSGTDLEPEYLWLDGDHELFATSNGWQTLIRSGWEALDARLYDAQERADFQLLEGLAAQLPRHPAGVVAIHHVRVFDSVAGRTGEPVTVYFFRGRVTRIDPANAAPPADVQRIDGTGHTLLPGLADMHDHASGWRSLLQIAGGITTARDLANDNDSLLSLQQRIEAGRVIGPRLHRAGFIDAKSPYSAPTGNNIETLEEGLQRVEWYAQHGYSQLKLYSSLDPQWVEPIAQAAHQRGLRVGGHIPSFMTAEQAVRAGYDEINHINMVFLNFVAGPKDDTRTPVRFRAVGERAGTLDLESAAVRDFLALLKSRGTVVDPTVAIFEDMFLSRAGTVSPTFAAVAQHLPVSVQRRTKAGVLELSAVERKQYAVSFEALLRMIGKLHAAGIPLVAGTDHVPGFTLHRELELYVRAGIPAPRVLQIATLEAMRLLGVDQSRGSVEPGKVADLVLVRGDPATNISDIRNVRLVVKDGVLYDPAALYRAAGVQPFD